jgi:hypothetical protein
MRRLAIAFLMLCGAAWGTACPSGYAHSTSFNVPANAIFGGTTFTNKGWRFSGGSQFAQLASGGQSLTAGGLDIVFCDSTFTNLVAYELVAGTYSSTTGYGQWYALLASASPSSGATLGIEWGKVLDSDHSNAAGVWGSAGENDLMVHHFGTSGTLTLTDSTGNCTATNHSATAAAGYIDGGAAFNGSSGYIDAGCVASSTAYTVESWANSSAAASTYSIAGNLDSGQTGGFLFAQTGYGYVIYTGNASASVNICAEDITHGVISAATSTWQHAAFTYNGSGATTASNYHLYVNGVDTYCAITASHNATMGTPTVDMLYGRWINGSFPDYYNGTLDEIRIAGSVRSTGWIQSSWFNETFNSASYYLGATSTIPTTGLDQLPQPLQFSPAGASNTTTFPKNLTTGSSILLVTRATGVPGSPSGCGASWSLIDSNTAGVAVNPYVYLGTGGSGSCTITQTGTLGFHAYELPAALGSTVDVHNNGSLAVGGQVIPTALTTTQNGEFMFSFVTGNSGALAQLLPAVSNAPMQPNALTALSGTNAVLSEAYGYTGVNGSYYLPFDNYGLTIGPENANTAEEFVQFALKPSALAFVTTSVPSAVKSSAYSYTLQTQGGVGALTCSASSGAPPAGIALNSNCTLTGTPTAGTTTFTAQVTDGTHTATQSLTLTVNTSANSCAVATSSSNTGAAAVSLGTVTSGNLVVVGTMSVNDVYVLFPTDNLSTPTVYKYIGTVVNSRTYITGLLSLFEGVATSTGSATVTSNCDPSSTGNCVTVAAQFSNCQTYFDDVSSIIGAIQNVLGTTTTYGPPLITLEPSSLVWGLVGANRNLGGNDMNFAAGSGYTADATSGNTGVYDMLGEHQSGTGGFTPSFGQTLAGTTFPQQGYWSLILRPTTTGVVNTNHRRAWVNQTP